MIVRVIKTYHRLYIREDWPLERIMAHLKTDFGSTPRAYIERLALTSKLIAWIFKELDENRSIIAFHLTCHMTSKKQQYSEVYYKIHGSYPIIILIAFLLAHNLKLQYQLTVQ